MTRNGLIIGYGNPLRGDDGLGWRIAGLLTQSHSRPDVTIVACHQLTPELAHSIARADWLLLIDARHGKRPGVIEQRSVFPASPESNPWTHRVEPPALLRLTEMLYGHTPMTALLSVSGASFGFQESFSPQVEDALPTLLKWIDEIVEQPERLATLSPRHHAPRGDG